MGLLICEAKRGEMDGEKNCDGRVEGIPIDSVRLWGRTREAAVWTKSGGWM